MFGVHRVGNRTFDQLRALKVSYDIYPYASGSTLFEMGNTRVLCAVTLQNGVPHFLRGKKVGWLTAEYSLLPASTPVRTVREVSTNKRSGRTIEISRLIGRSLRAICDLTELPEQTIFIDCDVLQADGGTRTACITGAYLALRAAQAQWLAKGFIKQPLLREELAAVSVGIGDGSFILDMDFAEDSSIDVDFNFVLTRSNKIIELQGSAERAPLTWPEHDQINKLALKGASELFEFYDNHPYAPPISSLYDKYANHIKFPDFNYDL